jgi:hypothetical protein
MIRTTNLDHRENGASRPIGREAQSHARLVERLHPVLFERVEIDQRELNRALAEHPRLIYVISHGGAISWLPIYTALMSKIAEHTPERRAVGTFHKAFWKTAPPLVRFISGTDRHLTYPELLEAMIEQRSDFWAFPESENSLYGDLRAIKAFRFFRFIELSVAAQMPMLLVVHSGSERWYRPFNVRGALRGAAQLLPQALYSGFGFDKSRFLASVDGEALNVPLPVGRLALRIKTELHLPARFEQGYATDPEMRARELREEAARIRARMQGLSDELRAQDS